MAKFEVMGDWELTGSTTLRVEQADNGDLRLSLRKLGRSGRFTKQSQIVLDGNEAVSFVDVMDEELLSYLWSIT